jgi:hypothetical protein
MGACALPGSENNPFTPVMAVPPLAAARFQTIATVRLRPLPFQRSATAHTDRDEAGSSNGFIDSKGSGTSSESAEDSGQNGHFCLPAGLLPAA